MTSEENSVFFLVLEKKKKQQTQGWDKIPGPPQESKPILFIFSEPVWYLEIILFNAFYAKQFIAAKGKSYNSIVPTEFSFIESLQFN